MRDSLYVKFILGYLLFALLSLAFVSTVIDSRVERQLISSTAASLDTEAAGLASNYEDSGAYISVMTQEVSKELKTIARYTDTEIWLVSAYGRITFDSAGKNTGKDIIGFDPALDTGYITGTQGGLYTGEMLSVIAPVNSNFTALGYVVFNYPMELILRSKETVMRSVYLTASVVLCLSLILIVIFHFAVYRPLKRITDGAREYAKGNMAYRIRKAETRDEMGYLAATLNYMAEEQTNLEKYQRDFVANVSHDFRSPLTSIRGYLAAILDGTIPTELHEKYITRVIGETDRLQKLTEEMLTLDTLDSKVLLRKTSFDINRMVRDVCNSYENACKQKDLQFELLFEQNKEFVTADYDKIQRVLYNLVDNAIKFSYPGSVITITTAARQKKVFVSVKDRGEGIPRASLKKIWDRFYKEDSSRGKDKRGNGIGLSIVKEIITAHNETIDVISTEKVGTEFTFSLPQSETENQK